MYNLLDGIDGSIYRAIARRAGLEVFAGYIQTDACHWFQARTCGNLKVINLDTGIFVDMFTGENQNVVVGNVFFAVGKAEESFVCLIQVFWFEIYAKHM